MNTPILPFLLVLSVLVACKKNTDFAAADLEVRATLVNTVNGTGLPTPYAGKELYITKDPNFESYLFTAKTDDQGLALFQGLDNHVVYYVFGKERPTDGLHAFGSLQVTMAEDLPTQELQLLPEGTDQNGFVITVTNLTGTPLPGVEVCVATSALALSLPGCSSAVFSGSTDAYGRASKLNIASGTFYARLKSPTLFVDTVIAFEVPATAIARPVAAVLTNAPTGLRLVCTDTNGGTIPMVRICAFSSALLVNEDCSLSSFQGTTDQQGRYEGLGLAPGTYQVRFTQDSLDIELLREYSIVPQQVQVDTVVVL